MTRLIPLGELSTRPAMNEVCDLNHFEESRSTTKKHAKHGKEMRPRKRLD